MSEMSVEEAMEHARTHRPMSKQMWAASVLRQEVIRLHAAVEVVRALPALGWQGDKLDRGDVLRILEATNES